MASVNTRLGPPSPLLSPPSIGIKEEPQDPPSPTADERFSNLCHSRSPGSTDGHGPGEARFRHPRTRTHSEVASDDEPDTGHSKYIKQEPDDAHPPGLTLREKLAQCSMDGLSAPERTVRRRVKVMEWLIESGYSDALGKDPTWYALAVFAIKLHQDDALAQCLQMSASQRRSLLGIVDITLAPLDEREQAWHALLSGTEHPEERAALLAQVQAVMKEFPAFCVDLRARLVDTEVRREASQQDVVARTNALRRLHGDTAVAAAMGVSTYDLTSRAGKRSDAVAPLTREERAGKHQQPLAAGSMLEDGQELRALPVLAAQQRIDIPMERLRALRSTGQPPKAYETLLLLDHLRLSNKGTQFDVLLSRFFSGNAACRSGAEAARLAGLKRDLVLPQLTGPQLAEAELLRRAVVGDASQEARDAAHERLNDLQSVLRRRT